MLGCSIDWNATGTMLSGIGTIFGAFAVAFAAFKGADTFQKWKQQKAAERRMSVAEDILTWAYQFEQVLPSIRSPATFGYESDQSEEKLKLDIPGFEQRDNRHLLQQSQVILTRVSAHQEKWDRLFELMPLAKAYFGQATFGDLQELWRVIASVRSAALTYQGGPEHLRKMEGRFWEGAAEPDELKDQADVAVKRLTDRLLPEIGANKI